MLGAAWTPIDPSRFKKPLRDRVLVALAGPAVNLAFAALFIGITLLLRAFDRAPVGSFNFSVAYFMVHLNLVLFTFNLLPVPGLDGGDVARYFMPAGLRESFDSMRPYGILIAIILMSPKLLGVWWFLPVYLVEGLVFGYAG
jgi:Zn-dependent protease